MPIVGWLSTSVPLKRRCGLFDEVQLLDALENLLSECFENREDDAWSLLSEAESREAEADRHHSALRPAVIRQELGGSFSRNSDRLVAHTPGGPQSQALLGYAGTNGA